MSPLLYCFKASCGVIQTDRMFSLLSMVSWYQCASCCDVVSFCEGMDVMRKCVKYCLFDRSASNFGVKKQHNDGHLCIEWAFNCSDTNVFQRDASL